MSDQNLIKAKEGGGEGLQLFRVDQVDRENILVTTVNLFKPTSASSLIACHACIISYLSNILGQVGYMFTRCLRYITVERRGWGMSFLHPAWSKAQVKCKEREVGPRKSARRWGLGIKSSSYMYLAWWLLIETCLASLHSTCRAEQKGGKAFMFFFSCTSKQVCTLIGKVDVILHGELKMIAKLLGLMVQIVGERTKGVIHM